MLTSINKKHQKQVDKALRKLARYNSYNNLRDIADGEGDDKTYKQLNKLCEQLFDEYLDIISELPSREVKQIETSKYY
jgi:DNA-binding Xre family transcriptional regulator